MWSHCPGKSVQEGESESGAGVAGSLPKHWERVKGKLPFSEKKESQKCGSRGGGGNSSTGRWNLLWRRGPCTHIRCPWSPSSQRSLAGSSFSGVFGFCPVLRFGQSEKWRGSSLCSWVLPASRDVVSPERPLRYGRSDVHRNRRLWVKSLCYVSLLLVVMNCA